MQGYKTFMAKPKDVEQQRKWYLVDATDIPLGRLAARVAHVLMGKHKPEYTPHVDTGDFVIIINAANVKLTGKKIDQSVIHSYSGYKGGLKSVPYRVMLEKSPERLVEIVVKGMLPRNKLKYARKLKVYAGPDHPHEAQKPEILDI